MTESIVSTLSPHEQPTDAQRVFSDKTHTCPPDLPYDAVDARLDAGETGKAEAEAAGAATLAEEADLPGELTAPARNLTDVTVKLAYAWHVAW